MAARRGEAIRLERPDALAAAAGRGDEARRAEDLEVLGDRLARHLPVRRETLVEASAEARDRAGTGRREPDQQPVARLVPERGEEGCRVPDVGGGAGLWGHGVVSRPGAARLTVHVPADVLHLHLPAPAV